MTNNLLFAWCWIFAGLVAGAVQGTFFHRDEWLGGYASWPRRITRLGHVAFFGTGLINLLAAITARLWSISGPAATTLEQAASILLITGAVSMPLICYLSAWKKPVRQLFFIPVLSLVSGVGCFIIGLFRTVH